MNITEIKTGKIHYTYNIRNEIIPILVLNIKHGWVETPNCLILPVKIFKTKEDCVKFIENQLRIKK